MFFILEMGQDLHKISIGFKSKMFAEGLESLSKALKNYQVISTFSVGECTKEVLPEVEACNILILELNFPLKSELEFIYQLRERFPDQQILLISLMPRHEIGINLIESGISAYLLKSCGYSDLMTALQKLATRKRYFCSDITEFLLSSNNSEENSKDFDLTAREKEVLGMLVCGKSNKQIANCLNISENTIKTHRKNIQEKFGVSNLIGMVRYACMSNLIDAEEKINGFHCPFMHWS